MNFPWKLFLLLQTLSTWSEASTAIHMACNSYGEVYVNGKYIATIARNPGLLDDPPDNYENTGAGFNRAGNTLHGNAPILVQLIAIRCSDYDTHQAALAAMLYGQDIPASHWKCIPDDGSVFDFAGVHIDDKEWGPPQVLCQNSECHDTYYGIEQLTSLPDEVSWVGLPGQTAIICRLTFKAAEKNECAENSNLCSQICVDDAQGYHCDCHSGYYLDYDASTCVDVDECTSTIHACEGECKNLPGDYTCTCSPGYELADDGHSCKDVNECDKAWMHMCAQKCVNTHGSYKCLCEDGFKSLHYGLLCEDLNECMLDTHGCQHECLNTVGSYHCSCDKGFSLDDDGVTCVDIDECSEYNQPCHHKCVNLPGTFTCVCDKGQLLLSDMITCIDVGNDDQSPPKTPRLPLNFKKQHTSSSQSSTHMTTLGLAVSISTLAVVFLVAASVIVIMMRRRTAMATNNCQNQDGVARRTTNENGSGANGSSPSAEAGTASGIADSPPMYIDLMSVKETPCTHDKADLLPSFSSDA